MFFSIFSADLAQGSAFTFTPNLVAKNDSLVQFNDVASLVLPDNTFSDINFEGRFLNLTTIQVSDTLSMYNYNDPDKPIYQLSCMVLRGDFPKLESIVITNCLAFEKLDLHEANCKRLEQIYISPNTKCYIDWPCKWIYRPTYDKLVLYAEILMKSTHSREIGIARERAQQQLIAEVSDAVLQENERYEKKVHLAERAFDAVYRNSIQEIEKNISEDDTSYSQCIEKAQQEREYWITRTESNIRNDYYRRLKKTISSAQRRYNREIKAAKKWALTHLRFEDFLRIVESFFTTQFRNF